MADWQRVLDLQDVYRVGKPIHELAAIVAQRLLKVRVPSVADRQWFDDLMERRDQIADWFEDIAKEGKENAVEFDAAMEELYDWADTALDSDWNGKKLCWVKTF